ncbi:MULTISPECIES: GntR family transcriptional regulator [unclassified Achromobacter]|uniref:GntR family transcriptional regulator n=1 Tax=unclassified Achromobacter TaxID=2626865 RepID=UPI000B518459|nr:MULTISPECIES: GntR family transcriptional regulator [unclassified Achromobacter]OWT80366.1 GntR family transcriptional regulator [Achromobacter sp. HZ34]OWT82249.1 GntR family transcriptional regulator [Achromobacter sp. HZ28]
MSKAARTAPTPSTPLGASHSPLTQLVVEALREKILGGIIAPGERLVESRLSEEFSVSRMPVREALRQLAASGLVTIEPRRGATVTAFQGAQLRELVEVRATLEALNAKLAAQRHDPDQIAELNALLDEGMRLANNPDTERTLTHLNRRFHDSLGRIAANSVLQEVMGTLRDRTAVLFAPFHANRAQQNWEDHAAILRAVIKGDAELASLLAARHVYNAAQMEP